MIVIDYGEWVPCFSLLALKTMLRICLLPNKLSDNLVSELSDRVLLLTGILYLLRPIQECVY